MADHGAVKMTSVLNSTHSSSLPRMSHSVDRDKIYDPQQCPVHSGSSSPSRSGPGESSLENNRLHATAHTAGYEMRRWDDA